MNAEQTIRAWQSLMARLGKVAQPMPATIQSPVLHQRVDLDPGLPRNVGLRGHKVQVREARYRD